MNDQEFDQLVADIATLAETDEDWLAFMTTLSAIDALPE